MTGYKKLEWKDVFLSFIPIVLLSIIAIPIDYAFKVDYMLLYSGSGVPIYQDVSARLGEMGLRPVYTALMLITHIPLATLVTGVYKLLRGGKRKAES